MLQNIVIVAVALAILWPFISLAYKLIKRRIARPPRRHLHPRRGGARRTGGLRPLLRTPPPRGDEEGRTGEGGDAGPNPGSPGMLLRALTSPRSP